MGFFATLFLLASILFLERRYHFGKSSKHHTHALVSRAGGGALIVGFLLVLWYHPALTFPLSWWVFSGVLLLALAIGFWDDVRNINWKYQLIAQLSILTILYLGGVKILTLTHPHGGVFTFTGNGFEVIAFFLFLGWGALILNSVNWLDGVDGLCGSVMIVAYSTLFVLALSPAVYQPAIAILLATAIGSTLAFLVYNYPPARIIGGTAGSLFFGLVIVFVSVVAGTKIATTLLVLALPITDTFFVLVKRIVQKRSVFAPDKEHLHHVLQKQGWSVPQIVLTYTILTITISVLALSTQALGKLLVIILVFSILGIALAFFHFQEVRRKKWPILTGIVLMCSMVVIFFWPASFKNTENALIGGQWYALEVAATPKEKAQGLSGRGTLCFHCGMLFLFSEPTEPAFWMKDMGFSIDILWVMDNKVVAKHENLPFPSLETVSPGQPITKVIELPAGSAQSIPIGSTIYFW